VFEKCAHWSDTTQGRGEVIISSLTLDDLSRCEFYKLSIYLFFLCDSDSKMGSILFIFLFCLWISICSATSGDFGLKLEAKKLVRDLNLFPDVNLNIASASANSSSRDRGKIVEKPLRFSNLISDDDDVSVDDFGHYAGYYPIQHSHAAK